MNELTPSLPGETCLLPKHLPKIVHTGTRSNASPPEKELAARSQANEIPNGLSATQRRIYGLLGRGYTIKEIAAQLCSSQSTVKTHVRRILAQMPNIQSLRQLQHQAIRHDEQIKLRKLSSF